MHYQWINTMSHTNQLMPGKPKLSKYSIKFLDFDIRGWSIVRPTIVEIITLLVGAINLAKSVCSVLFWVKWHISWIIVSSHDSLYGWKLMVNWHQACVTYTLNTDTFAWKVFSTNKSNVANGCFFFIKGANWTPATKRLHIWHKDFMRWDSFMIRHRW